MSGRISVVIAAYHGEKYLPGQLRSIFAQSRPPDEIVVGDDSEDAGTQEVVEALRGEFRGQLRYFRNNPRLGVIDNFIKVAHMATGDYVFLSDQDDWWLPEKIEKLAGLLESRGERWQLAGCNSEVVNAELVSSGTHLYSHLPPELLEELAREAKFSLEVYPRFTIFGHNICMRRSFVRYFEHVGKFFPHDCWLSQISSALGVQLYLNEKLTLYRVHSGNTSAPPPEVHRAGVLERMRQIMAEPGDIEKTFCMIEALDEFVQNTPGVPEENRRCMAESAHYFRGRKRMRALPRGLRWLGLTPSLLRGYFQTGNGWRPLARDLFL